MFKAAIVEIAAAPDETTRPVAPASWLRYNWAWRRVHDLPAAVVARLRAVITATNGDTAVSISEVRCYQ
jgi:hypothetical protein